MKHTYTIFATAEEHGDPTYYGVTATDNFLLLQGLPKRVALRIINALHQHHHENLSRDYRWYFYMQKRKGPVKKDSRFCTATSDCWVWDIIKETK